MAKNVETFHGNFLAVSRACAKRYQHGQNIVRNENALNAPIDHIESYYASDVNIGAGYPQLRGEKSVETCIVGGGLAGITCARELARNGHDVLLLEKAKIGWAASGRNGGFVSEGFAEGMDNIRRRVGHHRARALFSQSQQGVTYVRDAIAELEIPNLIQGQGGLSLVRHGDGSDLINQAAQYEEHYGVFRQLVAGDALQDLVVSPTYRAGLLNDQAFHIQPLAYANALAADAVNKGAALHEQSHVTSLHRASGGWSVETTGGKVSAQHVVLATSAYGGPFTPLNRALVPVATYVVASRPIGNQLDQAIRFTGTISDSRRAGDYYRIIGKGEVRRLIWGGRITTRRSEPRQLAHLLKADILAIYPQLTGLEVEYAWSGLMAYARHKMPIIGEFWPIEAPGLWACTAFGGHGLNTTAMGGNLVADAISNGNDSWRMFESYGPEWTGGPIGRAAAQLVYWRMQMVDFLEERRG